MAVNKAIRADDVSGLNIATVQNTDTDAVVKDFQRVVINNSTDGTMAAVTGAGLKVDASGSTVPVSLSGTLNSRPSDGTNPITKTFDLDSGAGTEYSLGVGLRKAASGGSVEAGTSSDPLRVDPTGTTVQPVSASSLPLPTGAATAAKQPALGTAGTASADVITIQGKSGMTAVVVDGSGVTQPVSGTFWQATQPVSGTVTANAGSGTFATSDAADGSTASAVPAKAIYVGANKSGNLVGLTLDSSSNLNVNLAAGSISGGNAAASATGSAVPASADYTGFNSGGNLVGVSSSNPLPVSLANTGANATAVKVDGSAVTQPVSGTVSTSNLPSTVDTNSGVKSASTLRVVLATDQPALTNKLLVTPDSVALPAHQSTNVDQIAGTTPDTNSGVKSAGTLRVVLATDQPSLTNKLLVTADPITFASAQAVTQSGVWTVQPGNTPNTSPWLVQDVGQAAGGLSFFTASLTSTKSQVKGSAGTLYGITAVNNGSVIAYIQVFNKASASVTVGTTAPDYVVPVPAPSSGTAGAGIREEYAKGLAFGAGITVACTTTRTGSTSATCDVNVNYI